VKLAAKHNVPIRCVLFKAGSEICEHNDAVRALNNAVCPPCYSSLQTQQILQYLKWRFTPQSACEHLLRNDIDESREAYNSSEYGFQGVCCEISSP
jgi:hypothetical protein